MPPKGAPGPPRGRVGNEAEKKPAKGADLNIQTGPFSDPKIDEKTQKCKKGALEDFARPASAGRLPQFRPFSARGPLGAYFLAPGGAPGCPFGAPGGLKIVLSPR